MKLRVNSILESSYANGPGNRFVIWTQGCNFNCPGCFNPETHDSDGGYLTSIDDLFQEIISEKGIVGISVSGGEPLLQPVALIELLIKIKQETKLSVLVFTGCEFEEIEKDKIKSKVLKYADVLISGRYDETKKSSNQLISSSNQQMHFLTDRYSLKDIPAVDGEIIIDNEGRMIVTGIRPPGLKSYKGQI